MLWTLLLLPLLLIRGDVVTCERIRPFLVPDGYNVTYSHPSVFHSDAGVTTHYCALDILAGKARLMQAFLPEERRWNTKVWHILSEPELGNRLELHSCFNNTSRKKQLRKPPLPSDLETVAYFLTTGNAVVLEKRPPHPEDPHAAVSQLLPLLLRVYYRSDKYTLLGHNRPVSC